jgi:hypothetical protein
MTQHEATLFLTDMAQTCDLVDEHVNNGNIAWVASTARWLADHPILLKGLLLLVGKDGMQAGPLTGEDEACLIFLKNEIDLLTERDRP